MPIKKRKPIAFQSKLGSKHFPKAKCSLSASVKVKFKTNQKLKELK